MLVHLTAILQMHVRPKGQSRAESVTPIYQLVDQSEKKKVPTKSYSAKVAKFRKDVNLASECDGHISKFF